MLHILVQYTTQLLLRPLTGPEQEVLKLVFRPKRVKKHQYLLQEGEVCKTLNFITRGAVRQYTVDAAGKEHILGLYLENWWVGDRESLINGTPSPYFLQAQEPTEMLVATRDDMMHYHTRMPFMAEMNRVLTDRHVMHLLKRVHAANTMTAEQRLAELERNYPAFLQRFPQHVVASYLGMTKETFSRIRANMVRR
jgi:CRP-like cAMP-binding protein